jgi:hypothetical protein
MGLRGNSACTLGHQVLFFSENTLHQLLKENGESLFSLAKDQPLHFSEDLLRPLGFERADSLDASDFDGANVIHDLNLPIPREMHEQYDLVIDGGTLEHVFNFPGALENAMRMVKIDGSLLINTPANNCCGHGFYQFSPELFFRVLVPANGFEILRIYLLSNDRYFHVVDPVAVQGRVELLDSKKAWLMVHAKKIGHVPDKIQIPQQSDYQSKWTAAAANQPKKKAPDGPLKAFLRARLSPESILKISKALIYLRRLRNARRRRGQARLTNRRFFVPVTDWNVTTGRALGRS